MRRLVCRVSACLVTWLFSIACTDGARESADLLTGPECDTCRIEASLLVSLGDEQRAHLGVPASVAQNSRGEFVVATRARPFEILVFDSLGRHVTTFGRKGNGPGELQFVVGLEITTQDSLYAIDTDHERVTVFSPSFQFARAFAIPDDYMHAAAVLPDGRLLMNIFVPAPERVRFPLHVLNAAGQIEQSLGARRSSAPLDRYSSGTVLRKVAYDGDDAVWSARVNEYRLERWDLTGRLTREFVRSPAPVAPFNVYPNLSPDAPPMAALRDITMDRSGRLWVLYAVPDSTWADALEPMRGAHGAYFHAAEPDDLFDSVIEIVDVERGRVVASARVEPSLLGFIRPGLAYGFGELPHPKVRIWSIRSAGVAR